DNTQSSNDSYELPAQIVHQPVDTQSPFFSTPTGTTISGNSSLFDTSSPSPTSPLPPPLTIQNSVFSYNSPQPNVLASPVYPSSNLIEISPLNL
ncbi:hypothetical protein HAX54_045616, partial [Datura stramonium]|nr:hypothetical protein [Datura stramonium]